MGAGRLGSVQNQNLKPLMFDEFGNYTDSSGNYYDWSSSPSGSSGSSSPGLLEYLKFGGSTATGLLGALNQSRQAAAPAAKPTNWGLVAGIGAAVLVVLVLFVSLGRK